MGNTKAQSAQGGVDLRALLRRAIEMAMPNLRKYYRVPRKGKIATAYKCEGQYYADVTALLNSGAVDPDEPLYPKIKLPVIWGGPGRGVVCPPKEGTPCVIGYYDGDPNYPFILDIRWNEAPEAELDEFVIQLNDKLHLKIDRNGNLCLKTNKAAEEGDKDQNCILIEAGDDDDPPGKIVFRAREIHTYADNAVGGTFDGCPLNLRASTKPE